jgi:RNA polymerase sigma factor (sigma-70 family)
VAAGRGGRALSGVDRSAEDLLRDLAPQVVGILTRRSGDFSAAEDAVQEALMAAHTTWPRDGIPDNPRGWLVTAASRRLVDEQRSAAARRRRERDWATATPDNAAVVQHDDSLTVLLLCCHPALSPASAVALTLRAVGGLTTAEVARAYAVPESTMAQRISRAKATLRELGEPFGLPVGDRLEVRVARVLAVLYLLYNEGYAASTGPDVIRADRCAEAIRLARLTHRLLPSDPEVSALLALVLLLDARRPARVTAAGDLVPLDDQDRSLWDPRLVAEGTALLDASLGGGRPGPYQVQAAIAAVHDRAPTAADTDWPQVLALYGLLEEVAPSPFVTLARAVALAEAEGPDAAEPVLEEAASRLPGNHRVDAVRGHLAELRGDREAARQHYAEASRHTTNLAEQRHLTARAARLGRPGDEPGSAAR